MAHQSHFSAAIVLLIIACLIALAQSSFVPKGRKCRLQEQHCDLMHPDKQCCPGTSCGVRNINNNIVNICLMCRDIGQPCGNDKGTCCMGLKCQKITQFASACNPVAYKFFPDSESEISKAPEDRSSINKRLQGLARS